MGIEDDYINIVVNNQIWRFYPKEKMDQMQ